jgi:hypothetical protein
MTRLPFSCVLLALAVLTSSARADEETEKPADKPPAGQSGERGDRPNRDEMRRRMLERFDADKDGELSDEEREKMREFRREQFGDRGPREGRGEGRPGREGRGPDGPRPEGRRWEGRPDGPGPGGPGPGPGGRGPRGPEGAGPGMRPMGPPPPPAELFKRFDADNDEKLSLDEFEKLMGHLRSRMMGPPRAFRGPEGPGRPGARPEGRPPRGDDEGRPRRERPRRDRDAEAASGESKKAENSSDDDSAEAESADDATA